MPTVIRPHTAYLNEGSTGVFTCDFTNENDAETTPATITWTLQDTDGETINARLDVVVSSPAARILLIEATYTSNAGAGRPLRDHCEFYIKPVGA